MIETGSQSRKTAFDPHGKPEDRDIDHYTPKYVWELALDCFGIREFDLDPCSNSHEDPNIPAKCHFTMADDGLSQEWCAETVWINPPYSSTRLWVDKLIAEYHAGRTKSAIALVKGDFSTRWFQPLLEFPICLVNHRIAFINPKNNGSSAKFASAIVYLGNRKEDFYKTFDVRYSKSNFEVGIGIVVEAGEI